MTEFSNKPSYEDVLSELTLLQMTNSKLTNENKRFRKIIQKIQDDQGLEICEYFSDCNNIRDTADNYYFDNVEDCYWALVEYFGCSDPVHRANDYEECHKVIFGSDSAIIFIYNTQIKYYIILDIFILYYFILFGYCI